MKRFLKKMMLPAIAAGSVATASATTIPAADFAYPDDVVKTAESDLETALDKGDGQMTVNALVRYGIARTSVSNDRFPEFIAKVEKVIASEKDDVTRSMLQMLLADIYLSYYEINRYKIEDRETVMPVGDDADDAAAIVEDSYFPVGEGGAVADKKGDADTPIARLSGDQIKDRISALYAEALTPAERLKTTPLKNWLTVVKADDLTLEAYPSLYDFACSRALTELSSIRNIPRVLPLESLLNPPSVTDLPKSMDDNVRLIFAVANSWVEANPEAGLPRTVAMESRFNLLKKAMINYRDDINGLLIDQYKRDASDPFSVKLLTQINVWQLTDEQKPELFDLLTVFAQNHSDNIFINDVKNMLSQLSQKTVVLSTPCQVTLDREFPIEVKASNIKSFEVGIYRVTNDDYTYYITFANVSAKPSAIVPVNLEGEIPFSRTITVKAKIGEYGKYIVVPVINGKRQEDYYYPMVCSDIALIETGGSNALDVWAVNPQTGAPVQGVTVRAQDNSRGGQTLTRVSDAQGATSFSFDGGKSLEIKATKGSDRYASRLGVWMPSSREQTYTYSFVKPSLALYHQGDTMQFVAIQYEVAKSGRSVIAGRRFKVELRDANYSLVDTISLKSDESGRITGGFTLPTDRLTGYYSLRVSDDKNIIGNASFMVSDYKLPTYEVKAERPRLSETADGAVAGAVIAGKAVAYSGFPIANAEVEIKLEAGQFSYWRWCPEIDLDIIKVTTDAEGRFTAEIGEDILKSTPYPQGYIKADILVTSPSGENRAATASFALGKGYNIAFNGNSWLPADKSVKAMIEVTDALNNPVAADIKVEIKRGDEIVRSLEAVSRDGSCRLDLQDLPSGSYTFAVAAVSLSAKPIEKSLLIYNSADKNTPSGDILWLPKSEYQTTGDRRTVAVVYGTPCDDLHLLCVASAGTEILNKRWVHPQKGMNEISIDIPAGYDKVKLNMFAAKDLLLWERSADLTIVNPTDKLNIKVEHMRDKTVPLSQETVTVRLTDGSDNACKGAVILDIYNRALDAIESQSWQFVPNRYRASYLSTNNTFGSPISTNWESTVKSYNTLTISAPQIYLYDRRFGNFSFLYGRGPVKYTMMSAKQSANYAESMDDYAEVESAVEMQPEAMAGSDMLVDEESEATHDAGEAPAAPKVEYRPSEIALALFAPTLSTDEDGRLTYSFTVPNANTTWALNLLAYTDNLATDLLTSLITASKPLMVEPNMPRFLRRGDRCVVQALVMNNSEQPTSATTSIEVIDASTGESIFTDSVSNDIEPMGSAKVSFPVGKEAVGDALIVLIKSENEAFADGVRTIIPVLAAEQPVIDSETFYLPSGTDSAHLAIEQKGADAVNILRFCENPAWEVVSALPGLIADDSGTSIAASARVFAAQVSARVVNLNPEVGRHLKDWLESAGDEATLSKLMQNEDLKQLMLASTPWVGEAASDADRISRLALLFDGKSIKNDLSKGIEDLKKMQTKKGGWCWTTNYYKPSEWVTLMILNNFAELKLLGCYPSEVDGMVKKAWKYIDGEMARQFAKYPNDDYSYYVYVRSVFSNLPTDSDVKKIIDKTLAERRKNWKKSSTIQKAITATLLYRSGYVGDAKSILASLRQFAQTSTEQGMWWDSLERSSWWSLTRIGQTAYLLQTFAMIEPGCADLDKICQWLVINKTAQDWGSSVNTMACVSAILTSYSHAVAKAPEAPVVECDGKAMPLSAVDTLTGTIQLTLPASARQVDIARSADNPAWGSIMSFSTRNMTEIKAASLPELSIEKQLIVERDGAWRLLTPSDRLEVGETVRVRLILKATRDMDYMTIVDNRAACMEPVVQTPEPVYSGGLLFYLENRDDRTNLFIDRLVKGEYIVTYDLYANNAGVYSSGIATIQSQYAPELTAHSSGRMIEVKEQQDNKES